MVEMGKQRRAAAVQKIQPYRHAHYKNPQYHKCFPEQPFAGMVAGTGSNIYMRIAVVYHVKLPHPFYLVHNIMRHVLAKQIAQ